VERLREGRVFELTVHGKTFSIEVGRYAQQANGSVLVRFGDTVVLSTATASREPKDVDFFPLTVNYEERFYAVGKIPGGFFKREGKPSEHAVLTSRLIDRPLRPLFPKGFRNEVQVISLVMSVDQDYSSEIAALNGSSLALMISDIPFEGPVGGVLVGRVNGKFVINPSVAEQEASDLHLVVAGTKDAVNMVEAGAKFISEDDLVEAIAFAHEAIREICLFQEEVAREVGKPKMDVPLFVVDPDVEAAAREVAEARFREAAFHPDKKTRERQMEAAKEEALALLKERFPEEEKEPMLRQALDDLLKEVVRKMILYEGVRPDGRGFREIRPLTIDVGILPRAHGSGLFVRGQTQVISACTLGVPSEVQILDDLGLEEEKRFMHHYNFPPFSTGEVRPIRSPGRREIGHGALVERALEPVIPPEEEFPYTIRVVSDVLESNGSTSQASVCASSLALMDAGVPIRTPVAGIAMGLVSDGERYAILTDIQGVEDALGDMDFKVAGTREGVTALQMDIKVKGITTEILREALAQAREARLAILDAMAQVLPAPRPTLSPYAPKIATMRIDPDKIREVIGPGGRTINRIIAETGCTIDIEQDGTIFIAHTDLAQVERARSVIAELTRDVHVGEIYTGKVTRLERFGAFVEILPGKEGLVHVSELAPTRVGRVEDVVKIGDEIVVKVIEIDPYGRINLSRRAALQELREAAETRERRSVAVHLPEAERPGRREEEGQERRESGKRGLPPGASAPTGGGPGRRGTPARGRGAGISPKSPLGIDLATFKRSRPSGKSPSGP